MATRLSTAPIGIKRTILSFPVFNDRPLLKTLLLKLFNPDYSEVKEISGEPFCCKCGEQHNAPGARPIPSNQGKSRTCTLHAISKAVVSYLDKKNVDVKQEDVLDALLTSIGTTSALWPTSFDGTVIKIQKSFKSLKELKSSK